MKQIMTIKEKKLEKQINGKCNNISSAHENK
jgi:hypothetical protein